jgi:hypothetical protein
LPHARKQSIRIEQSLCDAKVEATIEHRTLVGQITCWGKVEQAAMDRPDLPTNSVADVLAVIAEPHERAVPFVPRSRRP